MERVNSVLHVLQPVGIVEGLNEDLPFALGYQKVKPGKERNGLWSQIGEYEPALFERRGGRDSGAEAPYRPPAHSSDM